MIAVDSSALMALVLNEPEADRCAATLDTAERLVISAATVTEALIVARRRGKGREMTALLQDLGMEIAPVLEGDALFAADVYGRWGKGIHPAGLNFGDCFSYSVAKSRDCPLLFVGNDFSRTDIVAA